MDSNSPYFEPASGVQASTPPTDITSVNTETIMSEITPVNTDTIMSDVITAQDANEGDKKENKQLTTGPLTPTSDVADQHPTAATATAKITFLDFPERVRARIYAYILIAPGGINIGRDTDPYPALSQTRNHQIRAESLRVYYSRNLFTLSTVPDRSRMDLHTFVPTHYNAGAYLWDDWAMAGRMTRWLAAAGRTNVAQMARVDFRVQISLLHRGAREGDCVRVCLRRSGDDGGDGGFRVRAADGLSVHVEGWYGRHQVRRGLAQRVKTFLDDPKRRRGGDDVVRGADGNTLTSMPEDMVDLCLELAVNPPDFEGRGRK
ncbi:hypothetical protein LTR50_006147 [Elasticomyces elasticus]|nr:hypothetical protein LTR50_006147 [Elasticomyces elasticus]